MNIFASHHGYDPARKDSLNACPLYQWTTLNKYHSHSHSHTSHHGHSICDTSFAHEKKAVRQRVKKSIHQIDQMKI